MRLLVAPDKFAGTLSAVEAADAIVRGWLRTAPDDQLETVPLSDGGPGFVDAMAAAVGGSLVSVPVCGPLGEEVPGAVLLAGSTAYVESAQACGLHLVPLAQRDPGLTTTYGVGQLVAAAVDAGATTVVVGLGGSATNDGGAGLLAALGATPEEPLRGGAAGLADLDGPVDLAPARERVAGVELLAATDVDVPLLGPRGATAGFAEQKGAAPARLPDLERALGRLADALDPAVASAPGAGAAGGLGYALLLLGARREHGIAHVMAASGFADRARAADLVVTGEGALDWQSLRGKVVAGVAKVAGDVGRPVVALAGRVEVGRRELAAMGVDSAYAMAETPAETRAALDRPAETLEALAARVARTWTHR
jgi:glycerate kinase